MSNTPKRNRGEIVQAAECLVSFGAIRNSLRQFLRTGHCTVCSLNGVEIRQYNTRTHSVGSRGSGDRTFSNTHLLHTNFVLHFLTAFEAVSVSLAIAISPPFLLHSFRCLGSLCWPDVAIIWRYLSQFKCM